jgi:hypothetical protein
MKRCMEMSESYFKVLYEVLFSCQLGNSTKLCTCGNYAEPSIAVNLYFLQHTLKYVKDSRYHSFHNFLFLTNFSSIRNV